MTSTKELLKRLPKSAMEVVENASERVELLQLVHNELKYFFTEPRNSDRLEPLNEREQAQVAHDLMLGLLQNEGAKVQVNSPLDRVKLAAGSLRIDRNKVDTWTLTLGQIINRLPRDPQFQVLFYNVEHQAEESGIRTNNLMVALDGFRENLEIINLQGSIN